MVQCLTLRRSLDEPDHLVLGYGAIGAPRRQLKSDNPGGSGVLVTKGIIETGYIAISRSISDPHLVGVQHADC